MKLWLILLGLVAAVAAGGLLFWSQRAEKVASPLLADGQPLPQASQKTEQATQASAERKGRPFLAIWRKHDHVLESEAPYLRIAIWDEGRVVFAEDPKKWSPNLRQGRISADQVAQVKRAIVDTGVFDLPGHCYLVPDAPCQCMMLDLGDKQQMLYWDEVEIPGYGINIAPRPHHLKFKECWKAVNKLALGVRPEVSDKVKERFQRPPESWILKKAIQSE